MEFPGSQQSRLWGSSRSTWALSYPAGMGHGSCTSRSTTLQSKNTLFVTRCSVAELSGGAWSRAELHMQDLWRGRTGVTTKDTWDTSSIVQKQGKRCSRRLTGFLFLCLWFGKGCRARIVPVQTEEGREVRRFCFGTGYLIGNSSRRLGRLGDRHRGALADALSGRVHTMTLPQCRGWRWCRA